MPTYHPDLIAHAAIFAEVATTGSFTAAAIRLGLAKSTVSARVRELEAALATRLVERTTRHVRVTEEGALFLESITRMLEHWRDATATLASHRSEPTGILRVTAPTTFTDVVIAPLACALMAEHPSLQVELLPDDRFRDLVGDNIDVAVRLGPMDDSRLVARKLAEERGWIAVATGSRYAAMLARCAHLDALGRFPWVGHPGSPERVRIVDEEHGDAHEVAVRYRSRASTSHGILSLVANGAGIGVLPDGLMALGGDAVSVVSSRWRVASYPLWLVFPSRRHMPARVVVFIERLEARMATPLFAVPP